LEPAPRLCRFDVPAQHELSPAPSVTGTAVAFEHDGWEADYPGDEYARVIYTWG